MKHFFVFIIFFVIALSPTVSGAAPVFIEHTIGSTPSINNIDHGVVIDFDDDGDLDVITAARGSDEITWWNNSGDNTTFGDNLIQDNANTDQVNWLEVLDFDRDRDLDIVYAARAENRIAWLENDGTNTSFTDNQICESGANCDGVREIQVIDFDRDGDYDIVGAMNDDDEINLFDNDGSNTSFSVTTIGSGANLDQVRYIEVIDNDFDGDYDVYYAANAEDRLAWLNNSGDNTTFADVQICESGSTCDQPRDFEVVDFDRDGDYDLVTALRNDDILAWFEDTGGFAYHAFSIASGDAAVNGPEHVAIVDYDNDGTLDVLVASNVDDRLGIWMNSGNNQSFTETLIVDSSTTADGAWWTDAADFDRDGDLDFFLSSQATDRLAWWETNETVPTLTSVTIVNNTIKGGTNINITANGENDLFNETLFMYCDNATSLPTSSNTDCTGGSTSGGAPYNLYCIFSVGTAEGNITEYCKISDGFFFSNATNLTYIVDSTPPTTSVLEVAGDTAVAYFDTVNDGVTNISVLGEGLMACRWSNADLDYASMTNNCITSANNATCSVTDVASQGLATRYVACADHVTNGQNSTQNLDISFTLDYTAPITSDDSNTSIQTPIFNVTIIEADNIDGDPDTLYCMDTTNACTPDTVIDNAGQVSFNTSHRGLNYLRFNSTDDAGNAQAIQSSTININQLPVLTGASDSATTILGGSAVTITTDTNDSDGHLGQVLFMYVCNATGANASGCTGGITLCSDNTTATNASCSFTSETDDAVHSWFLYIFDNSSEPAANNPLTDTYTTDSTAPSITIVDPDNTTYTQSTVTVQISTSEAADVAQYSLNGTANVSMTKVSDTLWTATLSGLANQQHNITFFTNDSVGNNASSSTRFFTVDTTANDTVGPSIVVFSPLNNSFHNSSVLLNISLSENGTTAWYSLDDGINVTLDNASLTLWNATITPSIGSHNITFYANDSSSNMNTGISEIHFFTFDNTSPQFSSATTDPTTVNDNASVVCTSSWTDTVALAFGIIEHNASGSFVNVTLTLSGTAADLNLTIPAANLTPGGVTCNFYVNDTSDNLNSTSVDFTVNDVTKPIITNISNSPTTEADLDINVSVNVTANITDNYNLTIILLQYKEANGSYLNYTMHNPSGDLYTGVFTPNTTNNWTFRLLAEDGDGNQNTSSETNLSIAQDTTWSLSNTIDPVTSIVQTDNRIINLGNITINNTGDSIFEFNLSSNVSWITFNGSTNTSLSVNITNGSSLSIGNVTANTTGFAVGLFSFKITVTPNGTTGNPISNVTEGQVNIQNTAGPFLVVTITTSTSTVDKGDAGVAYESKVENLGTSDATGVWLDWDLPTEFTLQTGEENRSIGNLLVGTSATNSITVDVDPTAEDKNVTINTSAGSIQGVSDSDSKVVTIGSPTVIIESSSDDGSGGGGASGGGGTVASGVATLLQGKELVNSADTFELVRGETNAFPIRVENIFRGTRLENVVTSIEGFLSPYLSVSPSSIDTIPYQESREFLVMITSPEYLETGTHTLVIIMTGKIKGPGVNKDFVETRAVTLIIHEISEATAGQLLTLSSQRIEEMESAGFPTSRVKKHLTKAQQALNARDFEDVVSFTDLIQEMHAFSFEAFTLIEEVKGILSPQPGLGITGAALGTQDFSQTETIIKLAEAAFDREDFETALSRAKDAKLSLAVEQGEFDPLVFLFSYWWAITIVAVLTSAIGTVGYHQHVRGSISTRIRDLQREEDTIRRLMKRTQEDYLTKKTIGTDTYHQIINQHQARLTKARKERTKLRNKRVRLLAPQRVMRDLDKEYKEVLAQLKRAQIDYLKEGTLSRDAYQEEEKQLNERLAEIEHERTVIEIQNTRRSSA